MGIRLSGASAAAAVVEKPVGCHECEAAVTVIIDRD
jgi:hypothetical protein